MDIQRKDEISISTELVLINKNLDMVTLFADVESLDRILESIKAKVMAFVPDISTAKGRKEIASLAYKVSQSKIWLDKQRKSLVADWKEKSKKVDLSGKKARDYLDNLRDDVRAPLTRWEAAEEERKRKESEAIQYAADWEEALKEDEVYNLKKQLAIIEEARIAKEKEEREETERKQKEADRIEREKRIDEEAKKKAEKEAEKRIEAERIATAEKIANERLRAEQEAQRVEQARLAEIKELERKAEAEKQAIIRKQKEKDQKEADRIEAEKGRQANKEHQRKINARAKTSLISLGATDSLAEAIIREIALGNIKDIKIVY